MPRCDLRLSIKFGLLRIFRGFLLGSRFSLLFFQTLRLGFGMLIANCINSLAIKLYNESNEPIYRYAGASS